MKPIFWILIGLVVAFLIGRAWIAGYSVKNGGDAMRSDGKSRPTESDLAAMGYNQEEIMQIIASEAYKQGTGNW